MAEYKGIKGYKVAQIATDPTANEGQTWYNTTTNLLKYDTIGAGAWAAGGSLNTARPDAFGTGFGIQTAAICAGGGAPVVVSQTEQYDGTSWTALSAPSNISQRYTAQNAANGTTTAGLIFGGNPPTPGSPHTTNLSEVWNGSTWTATNAMNSTHRLGGGSGTSTAAACFGGHQNDSVDFNETEEFNGTTWAVIPAGDMNTTMSQFSSWGAQTAGVAAGGSPARTVTETYNGATWTTSPGTLNNGRSYAGGMGSTTAGLITGGNPLPATQYKTESWNGSTWTEVANSTQSGYAASGAGTQALGLKMAGNTSPYMLTEEWDNSPAVVKSVTTS